MSFWISVRMDVGCSNIPSHFSSFVFLLYAGFVQTLKHCFPGLSRTCKNQIPGFSRTQKTRFQGLSRIHSVHKHGCMRKSAQVCKGKKYLITVFLKCELTQEVTKCTQCITMNFFSRERYLNQKVKFSEPLL